MFMILMYARFDNFLLFRDFEIDLSYPKKIVNSTIPEEHLNGFPSFRYRKLLIIMGANATGKTAFGRTLMGIYNFISRKEASHVASLVSDRAKPASFTIDLVIEDRLYRIDSEISFKDTESAQFNIKTAVNSERILPKDSYESCLRRMIAHRSQFNPDYVSELGKIEDLTWIFAYSIDTVGKQNSISPVDSSMYCKCLEDVLKALDPRLRKVSVVENSSNAFVIDGDGFNTILQDGKLTNPDVLSSGTREGIDIASVLASMKLHASSFYFCDEKFSHIHSEAEKAFLSLMSDLIGPDEQLLFTTHNSDILDMDYPKHSFVFLRRNKYEDNNITAVYASDYIKKNSVSLRTAVENDLFMSSPDVSAIYGLADYLR